jgi:hypothetical protein
MRPDPCLPRGRDLVEQRPRALAEQTPEPRLPHDDVRDEPGDALCVQGTST